MGIINEAIGVCEAFKHNVDVLQTTGDLSATLKINNIDEIINQLYFFQTQGLNEFILPWVLKVRNDFEQFNWELIRLFRSRY